MKRASEALVRTEPSRNVVGGGLRATGRRPPLPKDGCVLGSLLWEQGPCRRLALIEACQTKPATLRSASITLAQAATKSFTNFRCESAQA